MELEKLLEVKNPNLINRVLFCLYEYVGVVIVINQSLFPF